MRFHRLYLIIGLRGKLAFVFIKKKVIICCLKKLFSAKKLMRVKIIFTVMQIESV